MINPQRSVGFAALLPQIDFGNSQVSLAVSSEMCWLSFVGVVKHLRPIASVDVDIPSLSEDNRLCLRTAWKARGVDRNNGCAWLGSRHSQDRRIDLTHLYRSLGFFLHFFFHAHHKIQIKEEFKEEFRLW